RILGIHDLLPLLLNLVLVSLVVWQLSRILRALEMPSALIFVVVLIITMFACLPWVVFTGMEHVLQVSAVLWFVSMAAPLLSGIAPDALDPSVREDRRPAPSLRRLCGAAAALPLIRYESLLLIAVVVGLLLLRRRWRPAVSILGCAVAAAGAYGALSVAHG